MAWGQLAAAVDRAAHEPTREAYVGGFRTRDLDQITADMIAWQESGYSTDGMALPPVFAVVRLIASTVDQLPLVADFTDDWLQRPRRYGSALDLGDTVQWLVSSMALHGSGDLLCTRVGDSWRLDVLHPGSVQATVSTSGPLTIRWRVGADEVPTVPALMEQWSQGGRYLLHIPYLVTPQHPTGCTPITVARESLNGYFQAERQASNLLGAGTYSGGRLETDQDITAATAERYQTKWIENRKAGKLPVLGAGLRYVNDLIDPSDAQWLESRQFNSQQVAMMFGVPPDYLGMTASGGSSSLSYANSQDNDRRFRRNCLEAFTSQIEDALSQLAPQGRSSTEAGTIRFDYAGWEAAGADTDDAPAMG